MTDPSTQLPSPAGGGRRARVARGITAHPLLAYVALAYALSWAYWLPLVLTGHIVALGSPVSQFPALLGPLLAAFAITAVTDGRAGVHDLWARVVRWRVPARWWLFAVGSPLLLLAIALVVLAAGPGLPTLGDFGRMAGLPEWGVLFVWVMFVVVNGLGEETGWRGYALPVLRRRHGRLAASLLLVPIWAGWHLPLFFLLKSYRDLGPIGVPGFLIGLACGSIVLAWLYESAGNSVLIAALWHGTYNLTVATAGGGGTVAAVVSTGVMLGALLIARSSRRRSSEDRSAATVDQSIRARIRAKLVNPPVIALLRWRAHSLLPESLMLLTYAGRRSGRQYMLPLMYAECGDDLVVMVGKHETKTWWRNFDAAPQQVTVHRAGHSTSTIARLLIAGTGEYTQACCAYQARFPRATIEAPAPMLLLSGASPKKGHDQPRDEHIATSR